MRHKAPHSNHLGPPSIREIAQRPKTLLGNCLQLHATTHLLFLRTGYVIGVDCMHERIQLREKAKYGRIVARIPADLDQACRHLALSEGWGLGDLHRSLILVGACGSFLTLRRPKSRKPLSSSSFPSMLRQYLGKRMYAPRTGKRSRLITVSLPRRVADVLAKYSALSGRLRSHTYARLLRAGLLVYLTSEQELVRALTASNQVTAGQNQGGRRDR